MPFSSNEFDNYVELFLKEDKPQRILDVGAGAGKYGIMTREILGESCVVEAVEPFAPYIEDFCLNDFYTKVHVADILTFLELYHDFWWDWAILGDVIEHMSKSYALDVLDRLSYMAKRVLIITPVNAAQGEDCGNALERHISRWCINDFLSYDIRVVLRRSNMLLIKLHFAFNK